MTEPIRRCIAHCAEARDERGRWRAEDRCQAELIRAGTSTNNAARCAAAARRVGAFIAQHVASR